MRPVIGMAVVTACVAASACVHVDGYGWAPLTELADARALAATNADQSDGAPPVAEDVVPEEGVRSVEYPVGVEAFSGEAERLFGAEAVERFAQSPAPVIAPASMTEEQRSAYADSFRALPDGFFAVIKADGYDAIVNGTLRYAVAPAEAGPIDEREDMSAYVFSQSEEGANVSFRRYNTDYSLEFMCPDAAGGAEACVDEAACAELADTLILVGGGQ